MGKIKIHEIAKKIGVNSKEVLEKALELGLDVKTHMSSVDENDAKKIEAKFSNATPKKEVKEKKDSPVIIRREVIMTDSDTTKKDEAKKAEEASNALFNGTGSLENMPTVKIESTNISILEAIITTGIAPSKGQARTLVNQGGISLNDNKITDVNYCLSDNDFKDGYAILKKGKKVFYKLVI